MRVDYSERFLRQYAAAPRAVQKSFDKQAKLLRENLRHPSLRAKKYDESRDIWQARVNRNWRFYFSIKDNAYFLHEIIRHPE